MIYGVHMASSGDFLGMARRTHEAGGKVMQIFSGNPRGWKQPDYTTPEMQERAEAYKAACAEFSMPSFIHMHYLTNYATANDELRQKSIDSYKQVLRNSDALGCVGVVTHMGSHKDVTREEGCKRTGEGIAEALEGSKDSYAIIENCAGAGTIVGDTLEEIAMIYEATGKHKRVKFCIDTAHTIATGYEIRTADGWKQFLDDFDRLIGLEHVVVMHLNDSKVDKGDKKDRHENIGDGFIGNDGFKVILNEPRLKGLPGILEVPGLDGKGPDKANIDRLVKLTSK